MKLRKLLLVILPILFLILSLWVVVESKKRFDNRVAAKVSDFSGKIKPEEKEGIYEGEKVTVPDLVLKDASPLVLGISNEERWIEVDLSEQKLRAWEGNSLFLESPVSTGLPWWPTPEGEFRIWAKVRATRMEGGEGKYYYNLPNVPYVMFFENNSVPGWRGFSLHGTYWHNDFGRQHSHGCVNLPTPIAEKLYYWTSPVLPQGKSSIYSSTENSGTRIVIHS
jgi:lipoprotein-anchoring transpeptidase ErfK/SrfK